MEQEFLPIVSGIIAGVLLGSVTARKRPLAWVGLSIGLGLIATVVSGEFKTTWAFLIVDIPLVGAMSAAAFLVTRRARRRQLRLA